MKKVRVIFSPEAEEVYKYLNVHAPESKAEQMILDALNKKIDLIKANTHYGDPISKKLIPDEYKLKSDFSTSVSLVVLVEKSGSEKSPRAREHATGL